MTPQQAILNEEGSRFVALPTWAASHREIVVNLLDLISFLLVTPEIAHRLSDRRSFRVLMISIIGILASLFLWVVYPRNTGPYGSWAPLFYLTFGPLLSMGLALTSFQAEGSIRKFRSCMFLAGALLFCASRVFAVVTAMIESGAG